MCFLILGLAISTSCDKDFVQMGDAGTVKKKKNVVAPPTQQNDTTKTNGNNGGDNTETVQFKRDLIPILRNNCLECHDSRKSFNLDENSAYNTIVNGGYVDTQSPENSKLFNSPNPGHADTYLTPSDHAAFVTCMKEGAKNN